MIMAFINNDISIIKVTGDDTIGYLNNIITNDITQVNATIYIFLSFNATR